jgi:hypothetical protein
MKIDKPICVSGNIEMNQHVKMLSFFIAASLYFATRELQRKAKERNMKLFPYSKLKRF